MIEIKNLGKSYQTKDGLVEALTDVSLQIEDGDIYGIIGMSGAGKSTLVRCINMLEKPTTGSILIDGVNIGELTSKELREARRDITMIFQGFNLLEQRTILKNVCLPLELAKTPRHERRKKCMELLELVGLADKANVYPSQLSGGQKQRVAIARALATNPKILLCDEATSALDPKTTHQILDLIKEINEKLGITVIIITHQMNVVEEACNKVAILDGGVVAEVGLVNEVFSKPTSEAAKRLVYPEMALDVKSDLTDWNQIRLVFNGAKVTSTPIISKLAAEKGIFLNIFNAQTKTINNKLYGSMMLGVSKEEDINRVYKYLCKIDDVTAEIVNKEDVLSQLVDKEEE